MGVGWVEDVSVWLLGLGALCPPWGCQGPQGEGQPSPGCWLEQSHCCLSGDPLLLVPKVCPKSTRGPTRNFSWGHYKLQKPVRCLYVGAPACPKVTSKASGGDLYSLD